MAGEWIKVERSTADKPEVLRIARELVIDRDAVFGKLMLVWMWFDANSVDGVVDGAVDADVDAVVRHQGFAASMRAVGWLTDPEEIHGLALPNFDRHNAEPAKKRALTNRRQARWRSTKDESPLIERRSRPRIPDPVKKLVFEKDNKTCVYCGFKDGTKMPSGDYVGARISIDHVVPLARGGSNTPDNMVCSCTVCNGFKGDRLPEECGLEFVFTAPDRRKEIESSTRASTTPSTREEKRRDITPIPPSGAFLRFWSAWPKGHRKQAQGKCWTVWQRSDLDQHAQEVLAHVEVLKASDDWRRDDGRYVPAPLVYLNQRRWEGVEHVEPAVRKVAL